MPQNQTRALVLFDAENASHRYVPHALWEAQGLADVVEARAYGRPAALLAWEETAERFDIPMTPCPEASPGKNSTDIRIVIDAMDALAADACDVLVLVTDDTDFCHLAERARKADVEAVLMHARPVNEIAMGFFDKTIVLLGEEAFDAAKLLMGDNRPDHLYETCRRIATAMGAGKVSAEANAAEAARRVIHDTVINAGGEATKPRLEAALKRNGISKQATGYPTLADIVQATRGVESDGNGGARVLSIVKAEALEEPSAPAEPAPEKPADKQPTEPSGRRGRRGRGRRGQQARQEEKAPEAVEPAPEEEPVAPEPEPESEPVAEEAEVEEVVEGPADEPEPAPLSKDELRDQALQAARAILANAKAPMMLTKLGTALKAEGVDYRKAGFKQLKRLVETLDGVVLDGKGPITTVSLAQPADEPAVPLADARQAIVDVVNDHNGAVPMYEVAMAMKGAGAHYSDYGYVALDVMVQDTPGLGIEDRDGKTWAVATD